MKENGTPSKVPIIRLTTGYEVPMKEQPAEDLIESFDHLFRAIVGEHFTRALSVNDPAQMWEAIEDEIKNLIDNQVSKPKLFLRAVLWYLCQKTYHDLVVGALPQFFEEDGKSS